MPFLFKLLLMKYFSVGQYWWRHEWYMELIVTDLLDKYKDTYFVISSYRNAQYIRAHWQQTKTASDRSARRRGDRGVNKQTAVF